MRGPRRPHKGRTVSLGSVVPRVLQDLGLGAAAAVADLAERWETLVGAEVAAHCRPIAMRGSRLEIQVDSSVWMQQLQLLRPEILARLRAGLGDGAPQDLWLRLG